MNVFQALDSIEEAIEEAKPMPWPMQERSMVDKSRIKKLIARTRDILPEEVHQARWISRETQRIAEETRGRADKVVKEARNRAQKILSEAEQETIEKANNDEVVVAARAEAVRELEEARVAADKILGEADAKAASLRTAAEHTLSEAQTNAKAMETAAKNTLAEAEQNAASIRNAAEGYAKETRADADSYATQVLGGMELELSKILTIVKQGKASLSNGE